MDRCFEILKPLMDYDIKEILYPSPVTSVAKDINDTEITQPVIFAVEYALAKLLMAWGIEPYAMIGHSIGEYVAACLAGVFSLEDALTVVTWRGKLMQRMPEGSMLSVTLPEQELIQLLMNESELDLAGVNGPSQCVVSGLHQAIDSFSQKLEGKNIPVRKLHTSHAYHSRMMEPILSTFREKVAGVQRSAPLIPFISNLTGQWLTPQEAVDADYWVKHLRRAVRFADGASQLLKEKNSVFVEVGPGRTLNTFVRQHPDKQPEHMLVNLVRHPKEEVPDTYYLLSRLGQIWLYGASVDWSGFYCDETRHRLQLPTYPFQRQYYWVEGSPLKLMGKGMAGQVFLSKKSDISEWFYIPSWKRSVLSLSEGEESRVDHCWLVFGNDSDFALQLAAGLQKGKEGC
jgi:acyl transferase domain-containing protein